MSSRFLAVSLVLFAGLMRAQTSCTPGSNASNFDGTPINPGTFIWFNANFAARGIPSTGATISFTNSTISLTADQPYTINVPNAQVTFDPHAVCSSTTFNSATNTWTTTVPLAGSDEIFLSGVSFPVPSGFAAVGGHVPPLECPLYRPTLQALQPSDSQNESEEDPNQLILSEF